MEWRLRRAEELFALAQAQGKRALKADRDRCLTDHRFEENTTNSALKKLFYVSLSSFFSLTILLKSYKSRIKGRGTPHLLWASGHICSDRSCRCRDLGCWSRRRVWSDCSACRPSRCSLADTTWGKTDQVGTSSPARSSGLVSDVHFYSPMLTFTIDC